MEDSKRHANRVLLNLRGGNPGSVSVQTSCWRGCSIKDMDSGICMPSDGRGAVSHCHQTRSDTASKASGKIYCVERRARSLPSPTKLGCMREHIALKLDRPCAPRHHSHHACSAIKRTGPNFPHASMHLETEQSGSLASA